jgi:hypothetical protein
MVLTGVVVDEVKAKGDWNADVVGAAAAKGLCAGEVAEVAVKGCVSFGFDEFGIPFRVDTGANWMLFFDGSKSPGRIVDWVISPDCAAGTKGFVFTFVLDAKGFGVDGLKAGAKGLNFEVPAWP